MLVRARFRHSAIGLTARKQQEVSQLARAFISARQSAIEIYWRPEYCAEVLASPRKLIEERRRAGSLSQPGLTTHYSKLAFESGLAALKGSWMATLRRVHDLIARNSGLTSAERHWLHYVARSPALLQTCVNGGVVDLAVWFATPLNQGRLSRKLRRLVLRHRGAVPRRPAREWLELDTNCYRVFARPEDRRFKGAWLGLTGVTRGRRVNIPLAGSALDEFSARTDKANSRPGLRVFVEDTRLRFVLLERLDVPKNEGNVIAGLDKGYRTLLTVSLGEPEGAVAFGAGAHETIARVAEDSAARIKNRRRLVSYERSLRNARPATAAHIRRSNLGRVKTRRRSLSDRALLRQEVGHALNQMFHSLRARGVQILVVEDLTFLSERTLGRTLNRNLRRWMKGHLQRALAYKAGLHGVQLKVVNAAYTSQTCPRCGYPSPKNRSGGRFECRACSYTGSADAVAATNVLQRGSDSAITRWTRRLRVHQILHERWQSALTGSAWDSSGHDDGSGPSSREQLLTSAGSAHT